jgi:hypothetical protein
MQIREYSIWMHVGGTSLK